MRSSVATILFLGLLCPWRALPQTKPGEIRSLLTGRVWTIVKAGSEPAPGSIYVFLANGFLLQTSCVETYRIAAWSVDPKQPRKLNIVEDGRLAFTADILEIGSGALRIRQNLVRSKEQRTLHLRAVDREFVCPDLPRGAA